MAIQFTQAKVTKDPKTGLYHASYTVTGNDPYTVAKGSGDSESQAKRNAQANYRHEHEQAFVKELYKASEA